MFVLQRYLTYITYLQETNDVVFTLISTIRQSIFHLSDTVFDNVSCFGHGFDSPDSEVEGEYKSFVFVEIFEISLMLDVFFGIDNGIKFLLSSSLLQMCGHDRGGT